jgi:hypothetical protein
MRTAMLLSALLGLAPAVPAATATVTIKVEDASGAVLQDELVIVQDLDHSEHELLRALSDKDGNVPPLQLTAGLYRVIATAPYGLWQTSVREFLVRDKSIEFIVNVQALGTHGYGDIVTVGSSHVRLQVIGPDGQPVSGVSVLVRDRDATLHLERRYKSDGKGTANIELVADPTVVVVIYGDIVSTTELLQRDLNPVIRLQNH